MSPKNYLLIAGSLLILAAILATGCMNTPAITPSASPDLKKFNSTAEIEQYVRDSMATGTAGRILPDHGPHGRDRHRGK